MAAGKTAQGRAASLLALALPVMAGLAYFWAAGAPRNYLIVNAGALAAGAAWIAFGTGPRSGQARQIAVAVLLVLLFLPLLTGPSLGGIARWLPLGPFQIHAGMLAIPPLVVLLAEEDELAGPVFLLAALATLLQPDAASALAITFAAACLHDVTRDWRVGLAAIIGFICVLIAAVRGELPAQPFVERVLHDSAAFQPFLAVVMALALTASIALILFAVPLAKTQRYALAGSLFGFTMMAMMSNYPSALIGYGAAPILGYGLALGLRETSKAAENARLSHDEV